MSPRAPVIILGMGRSGTSILTRLLEALGLFVGRRKTGDWEAVLFQQLNKWLLAQSDGGLENPATIKYLLVDHEARALAVEFIRFVLRTPRVVSFLGWRQYLRYRTPAHLDRPWGWKDPRNTFTLPVWLDLFPEAKVVHIYRHGVDVVKSLKTVRDRSLARIRAHRAQLKSLYWWYLMFKLLPQRRGLVDVRCASLEGGLSLWEDYIREARAHVQQLGDRAMEIKYEELVTEPEASLERLVEFCELPSTGADLASVVAALRKERAYAHQRDPAAAAFAARVGARLKAQGY